LNAPETNIMSDMFTVFVWSMVMASILTVPSVIAVAQAATTWRLLKEG